MIFNANPALGVNGGAGNMNTSAYALSCAYLLNKRAGSGHYLNHYMKTEHETRIVELETRLAFQDHTLQTLNEVVAQQQQQLNALIREVQTLKDRLRAATPSPVGPIEDEKPPPHY